MSDGRSPGSVELSDPERLQSLYAATGELMAATTQSELCAAAVETTESILGLPSVGVHLVEDGRLVPISTTQRVKERFDGDLPVYGPTHPLWSVYEDEKVVRATETDDWAQSVTAGVAVPIRDHGVLVAGSSEPATVDEAGVESVRLLGTNTAVALDQLERERRLDRLHGAARELMTAGDTAAVAAAATNTAHEVLGMKVNAVFLRVSGAEKLVPVGVTAEAREVFETTVPDLGPESVAWHAYRSGDPQLYDDVRESDRVEEPRTPIRSELVLPLGEHGAFVAGSTDVGVFDQEDLSLAQVFAANVEAALDSADRQARLRRRESELQRQNERLEEFASVVSHDLRNPLNVATGQVELAEAAASDPDVESRLEEAFDAHQKMEDLIDDLLSLARHGRSLGETEPVDIATVARGEWPSTHAATLEIGDSVGTVSADPSRLRELVGNLLRNAVDHGGDSVTVCVESLADERGFAVADDGDGIDQADREEVFERGFTTNDEGTGYGLAIVEEVVEAHGWTISITESAAGGARFEVRTDPE